VPSRHIAQSTPASFRARATTAIFLPRVFAKFWAQTLTDPLVFQV
jgi:hypothetical protein